MACYIRAATTADAAEICAIERSATVKFADIPALEDLATAGDALDEATARRWIDGGMSRVAVSDEPKVDGRDHLLGFVACELKDGHIYIAEISVLEKQQGRGIGGMLLDAVFALARERGLAVTLTTYLTVPWNGPWYGKKGFVGITAEELGPAHGKKMDEEEGLVRPGYPRGCMIWRAFDK